MYVKNRGWVGFLSILCCLSISFFIVCSDPQEPPIKEENVIVVVTVIKEQNGQPIFLKINKEVTVKVQVTLPKHVDSVIVETGEYTDKILINENTLNSILIPRSYVFTQAGNKVVKASAYTHSGIRKNSNEDKIEIGNEPLFQSVETKGKMQIGEIFSLEPKIDTFGKMEYEWFKNSIKIDDAIDPQLRFKSLLETDKGAYTCIAKNNWGSDTSAPFTIAFTTSAPKIVEHPQNISVIINNSARFSVKAEGNDLQYQWKQNNENITGATKAMYDIPSCQLTDNGAKFVCIVSNSSGAVTSDEATLTVVASEIPPEITVQPADTEVPLGSVARFTLKADGTNLTFQWYKNDASINGATAQTYETPAVIVADDGTKYYCIVKNSQGSDTSAKATLRIKNVDKPVITEQPKDVEVTEGSEATFSVGASGTSLKYQWKKNSVDIAGATNSTYKTAAVTMADNGTKYKC